jgi:hypothetical protein
MKNILLICTAVIIFTDAEIFSQYINNRIFESPSTQIEPAIVRHPANPQILFASAFTVTLQPSFLTSEGIYVSTNGGISWRGSDFCNGAPIVGGHGGDPGPIIDKNGNFLLIHIGGLQAGMFSNYSTDQGLNWSGNYAIQLVDVDKGSTTTDDSPASTYYGRSYAAWTKFTPPFRIVLSYTSNSGANWSNIIDINNSYGSNRSFGPAISVGPAGTVYATWASSTSNSPFTEDCIGYAKSTNGGVNWIVNECLIDCNGIRTTQLTPWLIRANSYPVIDVDKSGGPRNGWIYIVVTDKNLAPAGSDPDIVLHSSADGGATWSSGTRVNQDAINNGRNQFFPSIRVDEDGGVNIIYYDSRHSADSVDVYLSRSVDGGVNWIDVKITQNKFKPQSPLGSIGNMGDNIGITSGNGNLYPVWMSNYGTGQIFKTWYSIINYSTIGIKKINEKIPVSFILKQNYPNPFNPSTKINFSVPRSLYFKLIVYDVTGKEVKTIVDQQMSPGNYETEFDGTSMASGLYFYKLIADKFTETKRMILIK